MNKSVLQINLKKHPYRGVLGDIANELELSVATVRKRWSRRESRTVVLVLKKLIERDSRAQADSRRHRELLIKLQSTQ